MGKKAIRNKDVDLARRIGSRIKRARIEKHLKQQDVAHRAKIEPSKLSKIENGRSRSIDVPTLFKIARAMEVSCDELCDIPIGE